MHVRQSALIPLALLCLVLVVSIASMGNENSPQNVPETISQTAAVATHPQALSPKTATNTPSMPSKKQATAASSSPLTQPKPKPPATGTSTIESDMAHEAVRTPNPYPTPALPFEQVNTQARSALVNILCMPRGGGSINPVSGSGVIIDPRGVILTNAHVAQYVLLSQSPSIDLSCTIRSGAPARAQWRAKVLFISPEWIRLHAKQINQDHPTGSGEHDYALLVLTSTLDGSPLPSSFPFLSTDTRHTIAFLDDPVLTASYPAEFVGGLAAQQNLYAVSSVTTVKQLLTFGLGTVDMISLGGVIGAQGGSSGGAVVNAWAKLVGIISTTSEGATTAERDLRALSLAYIDSQLVSEYGSGLASLLEKDVRAEADYFAKDTADKLIKIYLDLLTP